MDKSFLNFKPAFDEQFLTNLHEVLSEENVKFVQGSQTKAATGAHNPNPATEYTQMEPDTSFANINTTGLTPKEQTTQKEVENEITE